ncbi:MAG: glutamate racemase [Defluviitaleaceae bacterium]|nr:glutamate racemase [Defluviitaleaceae bacterium]MCL2239749.1 glutamate racemase [Defluviitaleaceae bacterium]
MTGATGRAPLGILDSGVGGLTVMRALRAILPHESLLYVGDTARAPYGNLSAETLRAYSRQIIQFFLGKGVKAVVLACGSSSSTAYDTLGAEFPHLPLIDVLRPGVAEAVKIATNEPHTRMGFIATAATVNRGLFVELVKAQCPSLSICARACPLFAPMAEKGLFSGKLIRWAAETYLSDWRGKIDALILGCTHYPLFTDTLRHVLPQVHFIDLSESTAHHAAAQLNARALLCPPSSPPPTHEYYVSGPPEAFNPIASLIMKEPCQARQITWR